MSNKKIKYTKDLNVKELSNIIATTKEDIINNTDFLDFSIDENKKLNFNKLNKIANIYGYQFYKKRKLNLLLIINIFVFLSLSVVTTYCSISYFNGLKSENVDETKSGTLNVNCVFEEDSNIKLHNTVPISDEEAIKFKPLIFTVKNLGTLNAKYKIRLFDYSNEYKQEYSNYEKLDYKYIKYSLSSNNLNKVGLLSDLVSNESQNNLKSLVLLESRIKQGEALKKFEFRLWLDSNADNSASNKYFVGKIILESESDTIEK